MSDRVKIIKLASHENEKLAHTNATLLYISGFGSAGPKAWESKYTMLVLKAAQVSIVDPTQCQFTMSSHFLILLSWSCGTFVPETFYRLKMKEQALVLVMKEMPLLVVAKMDRLSLLLLWTGDCVLTIDQFTIQTSVCILKFHIIQNGSEKL